MTDNPTPNLHRHRREDERKEYEESIARATVAPTRTGGESDPTTTDPTPKPHRHRREVKGDGFEELSAEATGAPINAGRKLDSTTIDPTPKSHRHRREDERKEFEELIAEATISLGKSEHESDSGYSTVRMSPSMRDAIASCGSDEGTITVVDDDIEHIDSTIQLFAVDDHRDEVVISTHATTPLGFTVGSAMALAHPKLLHEVLDQDTLTELIEDTPVDILSQARQIGHVPFDDVDAVDLRHSFITWRREIADLIRRLKTGDYDSDEFAGRDEVCREILQQGHGLLGAIVHLLDEAGINVVRDIRVPAKLNSAKLDDLAETIAHSIVIQSRYESFAAYRQLFESRESHRERAFTAKVDSADPVGTLIGAVVIRGGGAPRLKSALTAELESYESVSDAPEFEVPITVRNITRETVAIAAERVLKRKRMTPTQDVVSLLYALVESPFRVTRSLQWLETAPTTREITVSELRVALQRVPANDLLPQLPRSIGQIVEALLPVTEPITQSELATRADVTAQTIRNYEDAMESLGVVTYERTGNGKKWRVTLPSDPEQDGTSIAIEPESALDELISDQCECLGTCATQNNNGQDDCPVTKWRQVQKRLTADEEPNDQESYELRVGESPKQLSLEDVEELAEETKSESYAEEDRREVDSRVRAEATDHEGDVEFPRVSISGLTEDGLDVTAGDEIQPTSGACGAIDEAVMRLSRQPESSLTAGERGMIRANWEEFIACTLPSGRLFDWNKSPLRDELLQYCHQHRLTKQTEDGQWETSEYLWMFLLESTALDEPIGADAVGQEQVIDTDIRDAERQTLSNMSCSKNQTGRRVQLTGCPISEGFAETPTKVDQSVTPTHVNSGQQDLPNDAQTTLTTFQSAWTEPKSDGELQLTTPVGQVYNSPETA
jgi:hypothetical protein